MMLARSGIGQLIIRLMLDRRVPIWSKLIIPASIIYMVSPIDFMPDFLLFLGWIDDIVALLLGVTLFLMAVPRDILREHTGGQRATPKGDDNVIDGSARVVDDKDE